jgi:hypothetical protein
MSDNTTLNVGTGGDVYASEDISSVKYSLVKLVSGTASSTARIGGDATNGLDVDVTRMAALVAGSANIGSVNAVGDVAHDTADSGNPVKVGAVAIAYGTNPTAVTAGDRTNLYANRAGIPFYIGGHPNIVTYGMSVTTAISNTVIGPTIASGLKFAVTALTVTADNANTVFPSIVIGFGTATTPAFAGTPGTAKIVGGHPGIPAGGGFKEGDGAGIIGVGADDEELRVTTVGTVTGLYIVVKGFTIES